MVQERVNPYTFIRVHGVGEKNLSDVAAPGNLGLPCLDSQTRSPRQPWLVGVRASACSLFFQNSSVEMSMHPANPKRVERNKEMHTRPLC